MIGSRHISGLSIGLAFVVAASSPVTARPPARQQPTLESLSTQFISNDWSAVRVAKDALESRQAQAIPMLIALLSRDEYVKLQNTADLIYPGATEFWGHGGIVDYAIDWLSVRAGWTLEDMTFESFVFREGAIDHDALLKAVMSGKADVPLSSVVDMGSDAAVKRGRRSHAVLAATSWWERSSKGWNRL